MTVWLIAEVDIDNMEEIAVAEGQIQIADSDPACSAAITLEDAAGFPTGASPDSPPTWAEDSNGTVVTLAAAADGLSATLAPVAPGTANVTVKVSAGGVQVVGQGTVTVVGGAVARVAINFTEGAAPAPEPAPAPAPEPAPAPAPEPAPAPAPAATAVPDPASGLPLYQFTGDPATIDTTQWTAVTDVTAADGSTLYTFTGDTPGEAPTGASGAWTVYTGATQPAAGPTP